MTPTEIIEMIKREAEIKGLSRYQIAKMSGNAESQIKRWFEGTNEPSLSKAISLCHAVGLEIELKPLQ